MTVNQVIGIAVMSGAVGWLLGYFMHMGIWGKR